MILIKKENHSQSLTGKKYNHTNHDDSNDDPSSDAPFYPMNSITP